MLNAVLQALWVPLPVLVGGLTHVAVIKLRAFPRLAALPMDGGLTFRGRRILGANKTVRGLLVMPAATSAWCWILVRGAEALGWNLPSWVDFQTVSPLLWGALMGLGYIVGELPNSFLKRQLDIAPGASGGRVFWVLDQLDSLVGTLLAMALVAPAPWDVALSLVFISLVLHPAVALLMKVLGLKDRVG